MFSKLLHFIKYNNAAIIILALILILGGAALAAGPEAIGQRQTSVEGLDNTALLAADLDKFNMDFKIENIKQDNKYYYATYSYLDLAVLDNAWQYQLNSRAQKISKKIKQDVGEYLAKFLAKHYEARLRELREAQNQARAQGEQKRVEVIEYSGLVGKTLNLAAKAFPGYEPVKKRELPAPEFNVTIPNSLAASSGQADNLTQIYNDYVAAHPEIFTDSAGSPQADLASSTPVASSTQPDLTAPVMADTIMASSSEETVVREAPANTPIPEIPSPETPLTAIPEPESVNVIELPAAAADGTVPTEPAPAQ